MADNQPTTRRERRIAARKAQILDAAATVFSEKGFERATTREIADAADVSEGTLYNYFDSKRDLLLGLVQNIAAETLQNLGNTQLDNIEAVMQQVLTHRFQEVRQRPLLTLFLHEARLHPDVYRQYVRQVFQPVKQGLEMAMQSLVEQGAIRPVDPAIAARALISMSMGFAILFELGNDPVLEDTPSAELAAVVTDLFLNGLRDNPAADLEQAAGSQRLADGGQPVQGTRHG